MRRLVIGFLVLLVLDPTNGFDPLGWVVGKTKEIGKVLEPVTMDGAKSYLQKFGYVEPSAIVNSPSSGSDSKGLGDVLKSAVR